MSPNDWTEVLAICSIVLAICAIFGGTISRFIRRPKLKVQVILRPPYCHKTFMGDAGIPCYYFRIVVNNDGKTSARNVEVFARELLKKQNNNILVTVSFSPSNLRWTHTQAVLYPVIHPHSIKMCDVFHITDPKGRDKIPSEKLRLGIPSNRASLSFEVSPLPFTKEYQQPPGEYYLKLLVGAEDARARKKTLRIAFNGEWAGSESDMLHDNVEFSVVQDPSTARVFRYAYKL
jgi:hypothetical protein